MIYVVCRDIDSYKNWREMFSHFKDTDLHPIINSLDSRGIEIDKLKDDVLFHVGWLLNKDCVDILHNIMLSIKPIMEEIKDVV